MNKMLLWIIIFGVLVAGCQQVEDAEDMEHVETAVSIPTPTVPPASPTPTAPPAAPPDETVANVALEDVEHWFYYLGFEPDGEVLQQTAVSDYDLIVIEPIVTDQENTDFPIAQVVADFHNAAHPKIVIAYIDIGQAEDWRTYWQPDWGIGNPEWIVANDPDGWEGNYPVAFWDEEWQDIWLDPQDGYIQLLLDAGFDGIYLDWVEAYSDENVIDAADEAGVDAEDEMVEWVRALGEYGRLQNPNFIVIAQNAPELVENDEYTAVIDGLAQEQTWFDGAADNNPPGDCPLPSTEDDIDTDEYYDALPSLCQQMYDDFPDSTLHVSSEWYLEYLTMAQEKGLPVLTIDYAVQKKNVNWIYTTSSQYGFVPFTSERALDVYQPVRE